MRNHHLSGSGVLGTHEPPRHFTLERADDTLPLVKRVVADIVKQYGRYRALQARRAAIAGAATVDERDQLDLEIDASETRLKGLIEELEPIGCQLKDPRSGLIDFPALHDDREVLLCWKHGEPRIAFWHELDTGFAGRRPIAELCEGGR